jgi:hypothetical protein
MISTPVDEAIVSAPLNFQITEIVILESTLGPVEDELPDDITYNFAFEVSHIVNLESGVIKIVVKVIVRNATTQKQYAIVGVGFSYQVDNIKQHPLENGKIPRSKMVPLNMASLSTTRGIFYSMVRGTFLHRALMPIVQADMFSPVNES